MRDQVLNRVTVIIDRIDPAVGKTVQVRIPGKAVGKGNASVSV